MEASAPAVDGLEVVETAEFFPGCCVLTRTHEGPLIDTKKVNGINERIYVSVAYARELGKAAGMVDREELVETIEDAALAGSALEAAVERADRAETALVALRAAVRHTLKNGAVEVKVPDPDNPGRRKDELQLRSVPGQPKPDLE